MFVTIVEESDIPKQIFISIGKAGAAVGAWAFATASMITVAMNNNVGLDRIIEELADITSSGEARTMGSRCRSGPEGIWIALKKYQLAKRENASIPTEV